MKNMIVQQKRIKREFENATKYPAPSYIIVRGMKTGFPLIGQILKNYECGLVRSTKPELLGPLKGIKTRPCLLTTQESDSTRTLIIPFSRKQGPRAFEKISETIFDGQEKAQVATQTFSMGNTILNSIQVYGNSDTKLPGVLPVPPMYEDYLDVFQGSFIAKALAEEGFIEKISAFSRRTQPLMLENYIKNNGA